MKKCPFCEFQSDDRDEQKSHLTKQHYAELVRVLNKHNRASTEINWAAGEVAFTQFEIRPASTPKQQLGDLNDRLEKGGVPPYLIPKYVDWIGSLSTKQKSEDQIWVEFVTYAIPLVTEHLHQSDPVTKAFVKKLMTPQSFQN